MQRYGTVKRVPYLLTLFDLNPFLGKIEGKLFFDWHHWPDLLSEPVFRLKIRPIGLKNHRLWETNCSRGRSDLKNDLKIVDVQFR